MLGARAGALRADIFRRSASGMCRRHLKYMAQWRDGRTDVGVALSVPVEELAAMYSDMSTIS